MKILKVLSLTLFSVLINSPCFASNSSFATSFNCSEKDVLDTPVDQFVRTADNYEFTRFDSSGNTVDKLTFPISSLDVDALPGGGGAFQVKSKDKKGSDGIYVDIVISGPGSRMTIKTKNTSVVIPQSACSN